MTEEMFYVPKEEIKNVDRTRAAVVGYYSFILPDHQRKRLTYFI